MAHFIGTSCNMRGNTVNTLSRNIGAREKHLKNYSKNLPPNLAVMPDKLPEYAGIA